MGTKNKPRKKDNGLWWVVAVAVVGVAAFIGISLAGKGPKADPNAKTDAQYAAERNIKGKTTAKVNVVEWGDYL